VPAKTQPVTSLLRNRFILTILSSGLFLQIGIWVRNFGVLLYVMDKTHGNPFAISMISLAEFAPIFVFSFIGGTFADRWLPKRTMIWCDLLSGLSIAVIVLVIDTGAWQAVFFATFASSILSQFSQPAGMRLFKLHVPESLMQTGMSIYQTLFAIFMILGPMIGTVVYQHFGILVSIIITGIAFLLSAATLTFLPSDPPQERGRKSSTLRSEMALGVRYVLHSRILLPLGGSFLAAGLALGLIQPLGIFIVTQRLGLPKVDLQWFMTANGAAMLVGGALTIGLAKKVAPHWLLAFGMAVSALTIAVMGMSVQLWVSLTAQFASGLMMPGIQISINTMILKNTEESFVGRVNGILNPLFMGGMVVTMSMAGWFVQLSSIMMVYLISAVLFLVGILVMWPMFRAPVLTTSTTPENVV